MSKIYVGQTKLKLTLEVGVDITGHSTNQIRFERPDGTRGHFVAVVDQVNPGIISYTVQNQSDLNQAGRWIFWAQITYADTKVSIGRPALININREGDN
jgi:hypothetical protein